MSPENTCVNDDPATGESARQTRRPMPGGAYCLGEAVVLDGETRVPVLSRIASTTEHATPLSPQRLTFTVPTRDGAACVPSLTPSHALSVPPHLCEHDALLLPGDWTKAWVALMKRLNLQAHETVLIHEAHTTTGMLATLLAAETGAQVLALCDCAHAARRLIALGAGEAATYASAWPEIMREHGGADVVLDLAGGRHAGESTLCARRHARIGVMDAATRDLFDETQWRRFVSRQLALIITDWSPLREAASASEAAQEFEAMTRTSAWDRFKSCRRESPIESLCDH